MIGVGHGMDRRMMVAWMDGMGLPRSAVDDRFYDKYDLPMCLGIMNEMPLR